MRCQDLRPALVQKHIIETKNAQLQQIRENEARREAERELDKMWHDIMMKEIEVKVRYNKKIRRQKITNKFNVKQLVSYSAWTSSFLNTNKRIIFLVIFIPKRSITQVF